MSICVTKSKDFEHFHLVETQTHIEKNWLIEALLYHTDGSTGTLAFILFDTSAIRIMIFVVVVVVGGAAVAVVNKRALYAISFI